MEELYEIEWLDFSMNWGQHGVQVWVYECT